MTTGRCIFQGEFGEILIPDFLTFLDMLGKTGTLELRRTDELKRIFWDKGEIVFADSDVADEQLGNYLARNGWVTDDALAEARASIQRDDQLVRTLITTGALEPVLLPRAVKNLVLDIVYSIFEWREGVFRFLLTREAHAEKVVLRTSVSNVIMEGSRRLDEWKRIREYFPSDDLYPVRVAGSGVSTSKLSGAEREVLSFVDGRMTIADIVRQVEHDQFTVLNALLTVHGMGLISTSAAPVSRPADETPGLSDVERNAAGEIVDAFNNIFAGIHERIAKVKGAPGVDRFAATLRKSSFQGSGVFSGVAFAPDGRIPADAVLQNLAPLPDDQRLARLKATLDRLLAQQVVQLDMSYPAEEKKAVSELIAREKARISAVDQAR